MKLLCDGCGQIVPLSRLRQEAGALVFACPACGAQGRIEAEGQGGEAEPGEAAGQAEAAGVDRAQGRGQKTAPTGRVALSVISGAPGPVPTFDPPPGHCPKCIERHWEGALICARCGLVFANFRPELVRVRPQIAEGWRELHAKWDDPAAHERLLKLAERSGALADLGRLYRIRLAIAPEDPRAIEGRERIISRAADTVLPHSHAPVRKVSTRTLGYVMLALLAIGVLGLLFRMIK